MFLQACASEWLFLRKQTQKPLAGWMATRVSQYAICLTIFSYMQSYMLLLISRGAIMPIFPNLYGKGFLEKCERTAIFTFFFNFFHDLHILFTFELHDQCNNMI